MSNSFRLQRVKLLERLRAVEELLGNSEVLSDQKQYRELAREHAYLLKIAEASLRLDAVEKQLADNRECLLSEKDPEFVLVLREDSAALQIELERLSHQLEMLLIPPDPHDSCNTLLEIRAGTGGEEAALFVADVVRMYKMYADRQGWRWEQLSFSPSETGGFKEYVMVISGENVYRFLRYEGGGHRVQRVPETESQGRIHTSAITVAVLLEPDEDDEIAIREEELRIDTFRSSGAGGQHVNTTDSAVRITHLPTGVVVAVQDERSQHKNKAKALRILQARLYEFKCKEEEAKRSSERMQQMGSGDRSDRIRTYNFPQNRVTDHRNNMTVYALEEILSGGLDKLTEPLVAYYKQQRFAGDEDVSSASA